MNDLTSYIMRRVPEPCTVWDTRSIHTIVVHWHGGRAVERYKPGQHQDAADRMIDRIHTAMGYY